MPAELIIRCCLCKAILCGRAAGGAVSEAGSGELSCLSASRTLCGCRCLRQRVALNDAVQARTIVTTVKVTIALWESSKAMLILNTDTVWSECQSQPYWLFFFLTREPHTASALRMPLIFACTLIYEGNINCVSWTIRNLMYEIFSVQ